MRILETAQATFVPFYAALRQAFRRHWTRHCSIANCSVPILPGFSCSAANRAVFVVFGAGGAPLYSQGRRSLGAGTISESTTSQHWRRLTGGCTGPVRDDSCLAVRFYSGWPN